MTGDHEIENSHAELAKAYAARRAAQALAGLGLYDDAVSRLYYAVFHLVNAALLTLGIQVQPHGGVDSLLGQHLVQPGLVPNNVGRHFASLMGMRGQADYNRHFVMDAEGFAEEVKKADVLFSSLEAFLAERRVVAALRG
jgi:uncharacterized protein (UPF0332 family)